MTELESELRRLCAYYEWSEPPNMAAADVLQGAADALKCGELSHEAGSMIAAVFAPSVGVEANVGNVPPTYIITTDDETLQRRIIEHMRGIIARTTNAAKRIHLVQLMEQQIQHFVGRAE